MRLFIFIKRFVWFIREKLRVTSRKSFSKLGKDYACVFKNWLQRYSLLTFMRKYKVQIVCCWILFIFLGWLFWPLSYPFPPDYSTLFFDSQGELLRTTLANDQQYRFPPGLNSLPEKYKTALIVCEDKRFYQHWGVDPLALVQAAVTNLKARDIIRGGSTIPMQIARLAHPKKRTLFNKLRECFFALKLSVHFGKEEILKIYADHVPMGGNVVGVRTASYKYFGKSLEELTWAEAALFVVLPNSPSFINLSQKRPLLQEKRNRLLGRLAKLGIMDQNTSELACLEPLPDGQQNFPFRAPHFTDFLTGHCQPVTRVVTTLDKTLQNGIEEEAYRFSHYLQDAGIANLAVLVAETQTGRVRAYIGSQSFTDSLRGGQIDGVQAFRSTGSLLKPFLIAQVLDRGPYTMASQIQDVPTFYGTFAPQNASKTFQGLVDLQTLLIQSLNVPTVRLLNQYGVWDFYNFLKKSNLKGLFRTPEDYGLSLILGGAEASLWEMVQLYLTLGNLGQEKYLCIREPETVNIQSEKQMYSKGAAWLVLNSLSQLARPGAELYWEQFNNQIPVAWKTGTSYGQKDGWAIGINKQWVVGVWVGNFTGEGNPSLSGAGSAGPLLFSIFNLITNQNQPMWFKEPVSDLIEIDICARSGFPASPNCPVTKKIKRPLNAYKPGICPFHKKYLVDQKTGKSVCSLCWDNIDPQWEIRYIVPASAREILVRSGRKVDFIPEHATHCPLARDKNRFDLLYPTPGIKVLIPRDWNGEYEKVVFTAMHQRPETHLFWYLNDSFMGETVDDHQMAQDLEPGKYRLVIQDEEGFTRSVEFWAYKNEPAMSDNEDLSVNVKDNRTGSK